MLASSSTTAQAVVSFYDRRPAIAACSVRMALCHVRPFREARHLHAGPLTGDHVPPLALRSPACPYSLYRRERRRLFLIRFG